MWILVTAVITASLLGSMHCVGMCGPLAIWASGASEQRPRATIVTSSMLYHLGRWVTYAVAGFIAGAIGSAIDLGGSALGFQVAAARIVGGVMVVLGLVKLSQLLRPRAAVAGDLQPSKVGGLLVRLRPYVFRLPIAGRALATGLLTTLLPCGWLYLFALVAAGTGSPLMGPIVMTAFWIGTVPALVGLVAGTQMLSRKFTRLVPVGAALLLILTGCYTASGRGFAELNSLASLQPPHATATPNRDGSPEQALLQQVQQAGDQKLPCCVLHEKATEKATEPET